MKVFVLFFLAALAVYCTAKCCMYGQRRTCDVNEGRYSKLMELSGNIKQPLEGDDLKSGAEIQDEAFLGINLVLAKPDVKQEFIKQKKEGGIEDISQFKEDIALKFDGMSKKVQEEVKSMYEMWKEYKQNMDEN